MSRTVWLSLLGPLGVGLISARDSFVQEVCEIAMFCNAHLLRLMCWVSRSEVRNFFWLRFERAASLPLAGPVVVEGGSCQPTLFALGIILGVVSYVEVIAVSALVVNGSVHTEKLCVSLDAFAGLLFGDSYLLRR